MKWSCIYVDMIVRIYIIDYTEAHAKEAKPWKM